MLSRDILRENGLQKGSARILFGSKKGKTMTTWTADELNTIGNSEELEISPRKRDGSLRKPLPVWVIRVGDGLYIRSMNGLTGAWYRGVQESHLGHIKSGGIDCDVTFIEEPDTAINDRIDSEYLQKYGRYGASLIRKMTDSGPRSATIKLLPLAKDS